MWTLFKVRRTRFSQRSAISETHDRERWASDLDGSSLAACVAQPRYLPASEMLSSIPYMRRNGLDPRPFEEAFWARLIYPLNVLVLCLSALPFRLEVSRVENEGEIR